MCIRDSPSPISSSRVHQPPAGRSRVPQVIPSGSIRWRPRRRRGWRRRTHARTRTRAHPLSLLHSLSACLHTQQTAPSARVLRTAPLPPRACLHCTRRARGTLRARTPARARARAQPLSAAQTASLPAHTAYSTMGTHTPNDAARTPQLSPHHAVPRSHRQQPDQRNCSARLCPRLQFLCILRPSQSTP